MNETQAATEEAKIREIIESWSKAIRNKDLNRILANHAPDLLMYDVPLPLELRGIDAYRASWKRFFSWLNDGGTFEVSDLEVVTGRDVAFCHALVNCGNPRTSGQKDDLTVRLTVGLKRVDGQWTVLHEHHSAPSA